MDQDPSIRGGGLPLRLVKVLLVLAVAAWGTTGALTNVTDWEGSTAAVKAAAAMSTFPGGSASWRSTTNPTIIAAALSLIVLFKVVTAGACLIGAARMSSSIGHDGEQFGRSKAVALAGCMVAVLGLFVGWIVIGEGWFQIWRSDVLREQGAQTAFRYGALIALIALLVNLRDD